MEINITIQIGIESNNKQVPENEKLFDKWGVKLTEWLRNDEDFQQQSNQITH